MKASWALASVLVAASGCGGGGSPGGIAPTVVQVVPANGATGILLSATLVVTFSESMDCSTITTASLGESTGGISVDGKVVCFGTAATFAPLASLTAGATYLATVSTAVQDTGGNALAAAYTWSFTTVLPP